MDRRFRHFSPRVRAGNASECRHHCRVLSPDATDQRLLKTLRAVLRWGGAGTPTPNRGALGSLRAALPVQGATCLRCGRLRPGADHRGRAGTPSPRRTLTASRRGPRFGNGLYGCRATLGVALFGELGRPPRSLGRAAATRRRGRREPDRKPSGGNRFSKRVCSYPPI